MHLRTTVLLKGLPKTMAPLKALQLLKTTVPQKVVTMIWMISTMTSVFTEAKFR